MFHENLSVASTTLKSNLNLRRHPIFFSSKKISLIPSQIK